MAALNFAMADAANLEPETTTPEGDDGVARRLFTVAEYERMAEIGILADYERTQLVEGMIVTLAPAGSRHISTIIAMNHILVAAFGTRALISPQNPVHMGDRSMPEPDFSVLRPRPDYYRGARPRPEDVLLLVEISDSTLKFDRNVKRALYARHAIPEYWIVNVASGEVEVSRSPVTDHYASNTRAIRGDVLEPIAFPGVKIPVISIVGG